MSANIFPVCAGMSPLTSSQTGDIVNFPRMRGDEPYNDGTEQKGNAFSPYARDEPNQG